MVSQHRGSCAAVTDPFPGLWLSGGWGRSKIVDEEQSRSSGCASQGTAPRLVLVDEDSLPLSMEPCIPPSAPPCHGSRGHPLLLGSRGTQKVCTRWLCTQLPGPHARLCSREDVGRVKQQQNKKLGRYPSIRTKCFETKL